MWRLLAGGGGTAVAGIGLLNTTLRDLPKKCKKMRKNADRTPPPLAWIVVNNAQDQNGSWRSRGAGRVLLTGGGGGGVLEPKSPKVCVPKKAKSIIPFANFHFFPL